MPIRKYFVLFVIVATLYPGISLFAQDQIAFPAPTGPYKVGRTILDWVDEDRLDPLSSKKDEKRELMIWVWYPVDADFEETPDAYMPGKWGSIYAQSILGVPASKVANIQIHAIADAPLSEQKARYPVLIFMPGLGGQPAEYTALVEEVASQGYIVVGVNPTYSSRVTVFADGRTVRASAKSTISFTAPVQNQLEQGGKLLQVWVDDAIFAADQLEALNSAEGMFKEKLDLARLGIWGHSFGGATAAEFCRRDSRCKAGANLDGMPFGEVGLKGLSAPFMMMLADQPAYEEFPEPRLKRDIFDDMNRTFAERTEAVYSSSEAGYKVQIHGTRHPSFADAVVVFPTLVPSTAEAFKYVTIEPERGWQITTAYILAFFEKHLNSGSPTLLDGPSMDYPEVTLEKRP